MTIYAFLLISRSVLQDFLHQAQRPLWIWLVQRPRSDIARDLYVRRLTRLARLGQSRVEIPNVLEAFRLKSSDGNRWTAHIAQNTFFFGTDPGFFLKPQDFCTWILDEFVCCNQFPTIEWRAQPTHRFVREMVGIKKCFLNVGILAAALRHKIYSNGAKRTNPDRLSDGHQPRDICQSDA